MKSFKGFLSEGLFKFGDLGKPNKSGLERGKEVIHQWILNGTPIMVNGVPIKLSYISDVHRDNMAGGNYSAFKRGNSIIPIFKDSEGNQYKINQLDKVTDLGAGSGSGAGAGVTAHTESAQCVYAQAYWDNKRTKFTPDDLTTAYKKVDVSATLEQVLGIDDQWKMSCITGANILKNAVKGKSMSFHRGSSWVKSLEKRWAVLNKRADLPFTDINKWNPADIWLLGDQASTYTFLESESLEELNAKVHKAFKNKDIYGVSLKKMVGATHVDTVNYRPDKVVPKYKGKTIGKVNFYNSKDVYVFYEGGECQFRGFGGANDFWQGELGGAHSKLGKISHGAINTVLRKLGEPQLPDQNATIRLIDRDRKKFVTKTLYPLAKSFKEGRTGTVAFRDNLKTFESKIASKDTMWIKSKYFGLALFDIIKNKESIIIPNMISYASSATELSSAHLKLM
tara:strand:+ start:2467 stop:3822 length:1356 start_codon:yes stop_codon:yes gene_type:complete